MPQAMKSSLVSKVDESENDAVTLKESTQQRPTHWHLNIVLSISASLAGMVRAILTRRLSGLEILNNATLIIQKWLVSRLLANIFHYLNSFEESK